MASLVMSRLSIVKRQSGFLLVNKQLNIAILNMNSKGYRWCGVPQCGNTSIKTPNKLFVVVPQKKIIRDKWLRLARRNTAALLPTAHLYFCEDHFDMPNDMANYMEYHIMGSVSQIRMKPGCMPTRYHCQPDRRKRTCDAPERSYILKKKRQALIKECEKDLAERTVATKQVELGVTASRSSDFHNNQVLEYKIKLEEEICNDAPETSDPLFQVNVNMERESELIIKDEIKTEEDHPQCHICLSVGRRMFPLRQHEEIYRRLLYDESPDHGDVTLDAALVCWECNASLRNVERFRSRIRQANEMLQAQQNTVSLSTLTTVVFSDSNPNGIYLSEESPRHQINSENGDRIEDREDASETESNGEEETLEEEEETPKEKSVDRNKWAKRRALLNREPKFRLIGDCKEMFKKISFSIKMLQEVLEELSREECYTNSDFRCSSCIRRFDDRKALMKHNTQYHDESVGIYVCDICRSRFADVQTLSSHLFSHYYMFYCKLCDYKCYSEEDTSSHARAQHGSKAVECLKCNALFSSRREFYKHYRGAHEKHICDYCGLSYKLKDSLIAHIRKKHSIRECKICQKKFSRYNGLWLHNRVHHGPPEPRAYCVECDVEYPDAYRYKCHLANSVKHRPREAVRVPCPGCDKEFSKKINMKNHYDLVHLKLIKFKCDACEKYFGRNADLAKHRRRVHEGVRPPRDKICHVCGRGFTSNKLLAGHARTHATQTHPS